MQRRGEPHVRKEGRFTRPGPQPQRHGHRQCIRSINGLPSISASSGLQIGHAGILALAIGGARLFVVARHQRRAICSRRSQPALVALFFAIRLLRPNCPPNSPMKPPNTWERAMAMRSGHDTPSQTAVDGAAARYMREVGRWSGEVAGAVGSRPKTRARQRSRRSWRTCSWREGCGEAAADSGRTLCRKAARASAARRGGRGLGVGGCGGLLLLLLVKIQLKRVVRELTSLG